VITLPVDLSNPLTEEDVEALGALERDGLRFEIDNGRLILAAPRSLWHSNVCVRIANLRPYAYCRQGLRITRTTIDVPTSWSSSASRIPTSPATTRPVSRWWSR
jgi:hypothetical protein